MENMYLFYYLNERPIKLNVLIDFIYRLVRVK